jgi:hypothetical protein
MSVTFALRSCVTEEDFLNVSNSNAREILGVVGVPCEDDLCGKYLARDFEVMARRAMMRIGFDPELPGTAAPIGVGRAVLMICGRPEGYVRGKLLALVEICQARASDQDEIAWG